MRQKDGAKAGFIVALAKKADAGDEHHRADVRDLKRSKPWLLTRSADEPRRERSC